MTDAQVIEPDEADWRPGFAKRAENFDQVCARAAAWRWSAGETVGRVMAAVMKGTPDLTTAQRNTLLLYAEHLNEDRLEESDACVWPGAQTIADYLGCSESTARAHRKALEAKGYIIRDYTPTNRPAGMEAYDLAILLARLGEMEEHAEAVRQAAIARREAHAQHIVGDRRRMSAQAPDSRPLEQSQEKNCSPVRGSDAPSARSWSKSAAARGAAGEKGAPAARSRSKKGDARGASPGAEGGSAGLGPSRAGPGAVRCSPGRASGPGGARFGPAERAEMVRQEVRAAVLVCPRLAGVVAAHVLENPASAGISDAEGLARAAQQLLPEADRNNDQTVTWAWARHGARAIAMLAIALEDPDVKNPCRYFGSMAVKQDPDLDLRPNFARILRSRGQGLALVEQPAAKPSTAGLGAAAPASRPLARPAGATDLVWLAIAAKLKPRLHGQAWASCFAEADFRGVEGGVLCLAARTGWAATKIRSEFLPELLEAAREAGVVVTKVVVTTRPGGASP